jgi:hypothetical protein
MQERPNKLVLLSAIARFLVEDVRPALTDPRLAFRALIAAHLASVVLSELGSDDEAVNRELARLRTLFPDEAGVGGGAVGGTFQERHAQMNDLTRRLAARLEGEAPDAQEMARVAAALRESLREKLAIENPRFDTSLDIE